MGYHVAVDIGGTFTDLVALDDASGELHVSKSSSLPQDPVSAVLRVIEKTGFRPSAVELFVHGTTVTTNALIQRRGTRVAFVTNRGFRDVIFIQNANRRDLYSLSSWQKPRPLSSRYDCIEIDCRVDADGIELRPWTTEDVDRLIEHLEQRRSTASRSRSCSRFSIPHTSSSWRGGSGEALPRHLDLAVARGLSALAGERPRSYRHRRRVSEAHVPGITSPTSKRASKHRALRRACS